MNKMIWFGLLAALSVPAMALAQMTAPTGGAAPVAAAVPARAYSPAEIRQMVDMLGSELSKNYVFADIGVRYAAAVRQKAGAGGYDGLDADALAKALTADLLATARDGHLRILAPGAAMPGMRRLDGPAPSPVAAGRWIADGVAYLRLTMMPGDPGGTAAIDQFMRDHADAKTLVIDSRANPGGSAGGMAAIMPYLFGKRTPLVQMEMRTGPVEAGFSPFQEDASVKRVAAPDGLVRWERSIDPHATEKRLRDAQVFYLTSKRTGSAAETFALALKRTKRGTLIGENTAGAGHFMRPFDVGLSFTVALPIGRTFDPDTGKGFEGTGVVPDIAVAPEQALEEALKRAGITDPAKIAEAVAKAA